MRRSKIFIATGQIVVTAVFVIIVLGKIDLNSVWMTIYRAAGLELVGIAALFLIIKFLYALQMQRVLESQNVKIGILRLVKIYLIVNFYGFAISGDIAAGGITWVKLGKKSSAWAASGITVIYLKLLNMLLLFIIGIIGIMFDPLFFNFHFKPVFITIIIIMGAFLIPFCSPAAACKLEKVIRPMIVYLPKHIAQLPFLQNMLGMINEFPQRSRNWFFGNAILSLVIHLSNIAFLFAVSSTLGLTLPLAVMFWLWPVLTIITFLPSAFGGIGVREGVLLLVLSPYTVSNPQIVAFSLLLFSISFITGGLPGALLEIHDIFSNSRRQHTKVADRKTR